MDQRIAKRALRLAAGLETEVASIVKVEPVDLGGRQGARANVEDPGRGYDLMIDDAELAETTRELFINGHYAQSVEEGFKYLNNLVKQRSGLPTDGADLMTRALSVGNPVLKLSPLTTQSQKDQQVGYMMMLGGAMTGVRNPRAHEHRHFDDPRAALELLAFANHLARLVRAARKTRSRRRSSSTGRESA